MPGTSTDPTPDRGDTPLAVAVCTNRDDRAVAASLAAVSAQTHHVALVTSGLSSALVERHRRAFGTVLESPDPGLSRARNRALAWASELGAGVIAFVDDDAIVEPGWYEALRRHWGEAPPRVACIGGPIRPSYAVAQPVWLSDGIAHALTLLDRGSRTRDLDPAHEAVYGANISFRLGALREVGGFDPSLGHSGERVFFGEEDAVERELHRRGYTIRYVPDAAVRHVIGPERLTRRSFLRRRYAFGVALGFRRGRSAGRAAGAGLRSAAGALTATLRGDQARAMERAVRAAENAGVLRGLLRR